MSNIIPELTEAQIREIPSYAEQVTYRALRDQLPNDWMVVHSLELVTSHPKYESHADREADFVVFAPNYGVLVVEVKGGGIGYNKENDSWHSINNNGKFVIKNPIRQAKEAKYEIRRHLNVRLPGKKILMAHAAFFPDIDNARPLHSHDLPSQIMGTGKDLQDMKYWCESVFQFWMGKETDCDEFGQLGIKVAQEIYGKKVSITPSLAQAIQREAEIQINLTNQQKVILRQLKRRKRAIIEGGAGTGKTVLALDHAQNLARQGMKVLLLCYNKILANTLKTRSKGIGNLHAMSFHSFCNWRVKQVKQNTQRDLLKESEANYPGEDLYKVLMPDALIVSFDIEPVDYDVIIIDEGQDFEDEYWMAIEMMLDNLMDDARLYVFQDANQAIFTISDVLPIDEYPLFLTDNCRNTKPIHEAAYKYYKGEEVDFPKIEGEPIRYLVEETLASQAKVLEKNIAHLLTSENIVPEDIAVIISSDFDQAAEHLMNGRKSNIWAFKEIVSKNKITVETAKRFKGLEVPIIFLWITESQKIDEKLLYVSISRARLRLWIVCDKQAHLQIEK